MTDIIFLKRGRGICLLNDGYQYHRKKIYANSNEYWKCAATKKNKCMGSLTIQDRMTITKKVAHLKSCLRNVAKNEIEVRLDKCKQQIIANPALPIPSTFENLVKGIENDTLDMIAAVPEFRNVKSSLYNCRNKVAGTKKMFFNSNEEVEVPPVYKHFLVADYYNNGDRILIFGSEWSNQLLATSKYIFLDGTFAVCPKPFAQLITIHCDIGSTLQYTNIFPVLYVLMPSKKSETYETMFRLIKSALKSNTGTEWDPVYVMIDFEAAIAKALKSVFPKVQIGGCYYHFHKAIWRKGKELKLTKNRDKRRILALTASLPLLPIEKVDEGWAYIESQILEEFKMEKFIKYFKHFWLKNENFRKQWSVFGQKHRTNNFAEAWHFKINEKCNRQLHLYGLLNILHKHSIVERNRFKCIIHELKAPKRRDQAYVLRDIIIQNAQLQLVTTEITVGAFLDMMTRYPVQCIALALICDVARSGKAVGHLVTWRASIGATNANPRLVKRGATIAALLAALFRDECKASGVSFNELGVIEDKERPLMTGKETNVLLNQDLRYFKSPSTPVCLPAGSLAGSRMSKAFALLHMLSEDLEFKVSLTDETYHLYKNIQLNVKDETMLVLCSHYLTLKLCEVWSETKVQSSGLVAQDEVILDEFINISKTWVKDIRQQQMDVVERYQKKERDDENSLYSFLGRIRLNIALDALKVVRCVARSADRDRIRQNLLHDAVFGHHRRSIFSKKFDSDILQTFKPPLDEANMTGQNVKVFSIRRPMNREDDMNPLLNLTRNAPPEKPGTPPPS